MRAEKLVFSLKRLLGDHEQSTGSHQFGPAWPGQAGSALPPTYGTAMPMDNSVVYLGETCLFDITLGNQGAAVSALTIKVECSVEGGSTAVLYDNSQSPLQQLAFNVQEHLSVQTDIKEQGLISIVASAVFTDQSGERKYHVQFFKFNSASPVSVRTRVRHLPHIITGSSRSSSSSRGCGAGKTRCFLEVNVQNSTGLVMQLHAVRLLAAPGVAAKQIAPLSRPQQQQQQQEPPALQQWQQQVVTSSHHQQHDQQQQQHVGGKDLGQQGQLAPAGVIGSFGSSDTEMLQDIDYFAGGSSSTAAPSVQQKQQQQQQQQPSNHFDQTQQHQQQDRQLQLPGQSTFAPFGTPGQQQQQQEQQQFVHLLANCSHNSLWQIDHQLCGGSAASGNGSTLRGSSSSGPSPPAAAAAAGTSAASGPSSNGSSSSSSTLGRLELHWSTCDGRTGRLLTQPLTGPVPASGKEVLMQLHQVVPGPPPPHALLPSRSLPGPQQLAESLGVNKPFTAMFTLTAGPVDTGPLLVLYTTTVPLTTSSSGSTGGGLTSSSSVQLGTDSSSIQSRRMGGSTPHTGLDSSSPEVVVQGSRSRRVPGLAAGQSMDVAFELLPLRCGWLRLPTFVVASETDGRLLDGVHDVHILVV